MTARRGALRDSRCARSFAPTVLHELRRESLAPFLVILLPRRRRPAARRVRIQSRLAARDTPVATRQRRRWPVPPVAVATAQTLLRRAAAGRGSNRGPSPGNLSPIYEIGRASCRERVQHCV